mmetsp:Transcript_20094/g.28292  ORF Transcript_20094/g.28292 Transcript_20094/m.28292 type:complete len:190 (+) Transcript_20094:33-602(+)
MQSDDEWELLSSPSSFLNDENIAGEKGEQKDDFLGKVDRDDKSVDSTWTSVDSTWSRVQEEEEGQGSSVFGDNDLNCEDSDRSQAMRLQKELKQALSREGKIGGERDKAMETVACLRQQLKTAVARAVSAEREKARAVARTRQLQLQANNMNRRIDVLQAQSTRPFPTRRIELVRRLRAKKREGGKGMR